MTETKLGWEIVGRYLIQTLTPCMISIKSMKKNRYTLPTPFLPFPLGALSIRNKLSVQTVYTVS